MKIAHLSDAQALLAYGWEVKDSGCWEWRGPRLPDGYGRFRKGGRTLYAHRLAYQEWVGEIPPDYMVRHFICDNPPCINPEHLRAGTNKENVADRERHGRGVRPGRPDPDSCPKGHKYTPENTAIRTSGYRRCRECSRLQCAQQRVRVRKLQLTNGS
jgi:hypothetical protein